MNYCWRKVAVFISIKKSCFKENIHYRILKNNLNALGLHNLSFLIILLNLKTKNHGKLTLWHRSNIINCLGSRIYWIQRRRINTYSIGNCSYFSFTESNSG